MEQHLLPEQSRHRHRLNGSEHLSANSSLHDLRGGPDMAQYRQSKGGAFLTESPQTSPNLRTTPLHIDTKDYFDQPVLSGDSAPRSQLSGFGPARQESLISPEQAPRAHRHAHHDSGRYSLDEKNHNVLPEVVIEQVFNPTASHEFTPFTYVKDEDTSDDEEELTDELDNEHNSPYEVDLSEHPGGHAKMCWSKIRRRAVTHLPHHHRHRVASMPAAR